MASVDRAVVEVLTHANPYGSAALLDGIAAHALKHGSWRFRVRSVQHLGLAPLVEPTNDADAYIARVAHEEHVRQLLAFGKPVVVLYGGASPELAPSVVLDDDRVGVLGARHLLDRGFRHLSFCAVDNPFSRDRERGFVRVVAAAGLDCHVMTPPGAANERAEWNSVFAGPIVPEWLRSLPKPIGIMAANDQIGVRIIDTCETLGLRVPEDVAVLGVDNSALRCEFLSTPLSSVEPDTEMVGYRAAELLDRLMHGEPPPVEPVVVPPKGVVARRSTDHLAIDDPDLVSSVRFIRQRACERITVDDVLRAVSMSRSTLERRFKEALGRTPGEEIRRVRLERARDLLAETDLPMVEVAGRCGFEYVSHLSAAFKQSFGIPPSKFRLQNRRR